MAVSLVTTVRYYVGLSTDDKPADVPAGSRFYAFDTPSWYVFDGSDWYAQ